MLTSSAGVLALPMTHYRAPASATADYVPLIDTATQQLQVLHKLIAAQHRDHTPFESRKDATWLLGAISSLAKRTHECGGWPMLGRFGSTHDGGWWLCASPGLRQPQCAAYSLGIGFDMSFDLAAAKALPTCVIHMLDPTPTVVAYYHSQQSKANDLPPNLRFHPIGLGSHDHNVSMNNRYTRQSTSGAHAPLGGAGGTPSEMLTLASIRHRLGGAPPRVVKIDVEGAEWGAGMSALATSGADQLLLELHGRPASWLPLIETLVREGGYMLWGVEEGRFYSGEREAKEKTSSTGASPSATVSHAHAYNSSRLLPMPNVDLIYANIYMVRPRLAA